MTKVTKEVVKNPGAAEVVGRCQNRRNEPAWYADNLNHQDNISCMTWP